MTVARPTSRDPQPSATHGRVRDLAAGRRRRPNGTPAHPPDAERRDLPVGAEATMRDARDRTRPVSRANRG